MALIICPECSNEVSDKAPSCPKCGYPIGSMENEYHDEYFETPTRTMNTYDRTESNYGLWGFVLALISLFMPVPVLDLLIAIAAVVLSGLGMKAEKRGLAIAGLIIGIIAFFGAIALLSGFDGGFDYNF